MDESSIESWKRELALAANQREAIKVLIEELESDPTLDIDSIINKLKSI